jgi:orotidine-5'-phosphate decarboxylase
MREKLIVALDVNSLNKAKRLLDTLYPTVRIFKIGYQLFLKGGWEAVKIVKEKGAKVFLDLKLFDIPNTVSKTVAFLAKENMFMFNVHILGGYKMMCEAIKATKATRKQRRPLIIGVTLLTSFDEETLIQIGLKRNIEKEIVKLAMLAKRAGLDGVVASPKEVEKIKKFCGRDFIVVCPGIRLESISSDDQKRISTAKEAVAKGADYIVVGRPIIQAKKPLLVAQRIKEQIKNV